MASSIFIRLRLRRWIQNEHPLSILKMPRLLTGEGSGAKHRAKGTTLFSFWLNGFSHGRAE